jgi:hypothetical protein
MDNMKIADANVTINYDSKNPMKCGCDGGYIVPIIEGNSLHWKCTKCDIDTRNS